jgi:hypothetical protein
VLDGVHLTLMIGPGVLRPVPRDVLDALVSVQVTARAHGTSAFQLQFTLGTESRLRTMFMLAAASALPLMRVLIVVTVNGTSEVLMDGVMTNHEVSPGGDASHATLTVTGEDLGRVMDYVDFRIPYPAMPREARVVLILAKYALFGIRPLVIPSPLVDIDLPTGRIPAQHGTDLKYIRCLADEVGYVFYVDPGPRPGRSIAYWGPRIKIGAPQRALNVDMGALSNVEALSFGYNGDAKTLPGLLIQEENTKAVLGIPLPDITVLNPPLGLVPPVPKGIEWVSGTGKVSPARAALIGIANAIKKDDAVTAKGSLDVVRYGGLLKPRRLVAARGAGIAFDGLYFVDSVTSTLRRGEFKQSFELSRSGLVSTLGRVPA